MNGMKGKIEFRDPLTKNLIAYGTAVSVEISRTSDQTPFTMYSPRWENNCTVTFRNDKESEHLACFLDDCNARHSSTQLDCKFTDQTGEWTMRDAFLTGYSMSCLNFTAPENSEYKFSLKCQDLNYREIKESVSLGELILDRFLLLTSKV